MKSFIKLSFYLSLLVLLSFGCRKAETVDTQICDCPTSADHPKAAELQSIMDEYVAKGLPGMSLLISDSSGVWYGSSGMADIQNRIAYSPCHVQKLGSITKMMMAVLTMKLAEEGKVNIDDKISKWIEPDNLKGIANADQVTLRQCMQHSTGIYDVITSSDFYLAVLHNPNKHWSGEELLKYVRNQPAAFPANTKVGYSNTNTILLSMCLDRILGYNHSIAMRDELFTPLGMNNTYYHTHDALPDITAQGYFDLYNRHQITNVSNIVTGSGNGYTGVYSTVFDLQKFVEAVFIQKSYLSQASLDQMMDWKAADDYTSFGLGLFRRGYAPGPYRIGHTGGDLGYASEVYYYPASNSYIILNVNYGTNGDSFLSPVYAELVSRLNDQMQ